MVSIEAFHYVFIHPIVQCVADRQRKSGVGNEKKQSQRSEKRECQCVVTHCIPDMLMWSVWSVVVEWRERRVVWRKVVEGKRRKSGKPKTQIQLQLSKKATTHFD